MYKVYEHFGISKVLWLIILTICVSIIASDKSDRKNVILGKNLDIVLFNKEKTDEGREQGVTCTDCKVFHPQNDANSKKIRHSRHKIQHNERKITERIKKTQVNTSRGKSPLHILFRISVNGKKTREWITSSENDFDDFSFEDDLKEKPVSKAGLGEHRAIPSGRRKKDKDKHTNHLQKDQDDFVFLDDKETKSEKILKGSSLDYFNIEPYKPFRRLDNVEQKFVNRIQGPMRSLIRSMDVVVDKISWRADQAMEVTQHAYNSTRFVMMNGVRELLQDIISSNNIVYGSVLDVTKLTRNIYIRSHQRQKDNQPRFNTETSRQYLNNGQTFQNLSREFRNYQKLFDDVKMMKMKSQQLADRLRQIKENLGDTFEQNQLIDIIYIANQTRLKLESEFKKSVILRRHDRYRNLVTDVQMLLTASKMQLRDARDVIRTATINTRGNLIASQDRKRKRTVSGVDGGLLAPVSLVVQSDAPVTDRITLSNDVNELISKSKKHAKKLEEISKYAERLLTPLIRMGENVDLKNMRKQSGSVGGLTRHIILTMKKLYEVIAMISYEIEYDAEFYIPCIYRDSVGDDCNDMIFGSGGGAMEGSGDMDIDSNEPIDMEFDFEGDMETKEDENRHKILREFGNKLHQVSASRKQSSLDLLQSADSARRNVKEKSKVWENTKVNLEISNNFIREFKSFNKTYETELSRFLRIHTTVLAKTTVINKQVESIQSQCQQAIEKAEKKVKEMQSKKSGKSADGDNGNVDTGAEGAFTSTITKVSLAKDEIKSYQQLRREAPVECENVQDRIRKMRSDIAQLKEKVNKARFVLSSLQLPVTVDNTNYIKSNIEGRSDELSMVTSIEVCIKPTVADGIIVVLKGDQSVTLRMEYGKLLIQIKREDTDIGDLSSDQTLELEKWYTVKFKRIGHHLTLSVTSVVNGAVETNNVTKSLETLEVLGSDPEEVYIGGDPTLKNFFGTSTPSIEWAGCISSLLVNGNHVPLYLKTSSDTIQTCDTHCYPQYNSIENMRFEGDGFIEFPAKILDRTQVTNVSLEFKTKQESVFIMSVFHAPRRFQLEVALSKGRLRIHTTTTRESSLLETQKLVNNDQFHKLRIEYRGGTTYPFLDGIEGLFSIKQQRRQQINRDGILLGGYNGQEPTDQLSYPSLIGCLKNVQINNNVINVFEVNDYRNINLGHCLPQAVWGNCVEFSEWSSPVVFNDLTEVYFVAITIKRNSKGPLLHFTKDSKFDLKVSVADNELDILETLTTFEDKIEFPSNKTFVRLVIQDDADEEVVKIGILEIEDGVRSISYSSDDAGWFATVEVDKSTKYSLSLGQEIDDTNSQFVGGVTDFIFKNKLHNFEPYMATNKLKYCSRNLPPPTLETELILPSCR
ncbi:hypothetical protein LOTGIDRAFT_229836 [Lottia gigantea]|uniref:Laminin G domain-containing protein n=1 Tax=Lottia gigantea TaxID=225164 RepID=V3ZKE0_LOTGI|nr:hypothetical protein LOTGIDRAFT_229836 [Lottia gigantea]ESO82835.1 hypothetical protein LOTGIDRAFT_229836 [Lottia gigantea]